MRLQPQLYIDTSGNPLGEPNFERVDFFDFEEIELTSSIQDVRDISKVFTDFSQEFSLPASKTNNKIFKHYYNVSIDNGFDARIKQKAEIYLNGLFFRSGYIRLSESVVKNGSVYSYRVTFFGGMTNLKNIIGDTELSSLSTLDKYNHEYNIDNVYDGFKTGLGLEGDVMVESVNRDVIYPSISALNKWFYDSSGESAPSSLVFSQGKSTNLYDSNLDGSHGLDFTDLKPAIKVKHIVSAIQDKYASINFSDDFFGSSHFDKAYMLLHNSKGLLAPTSNPDTPVSITYRVGSNDDSSDFKLDVVYQEQRPMKTFWESGGLQKTDVQQYHIIPSVTVLSPLLGSLYTIEVLDGTNVIAKAENVTGDNSLTAILCSENVKIWDDVSVRISSNGFLNTYELDLEIKQVRYRTDSISVSCDGTGIPSDTLSSFYSTFIGTQVLLSKIEITKNVPKIKILDFLKGLYNAFNLTSYVDDNGVIVVKPLPDYYNDGKTIDITKFVDNEDISVKRMSLYKNVEFKFSEPKTFGIINKNEISQVEFGDLEFESSADGTNSSLIFDGKNYKIKLPFEKMYFERLSDENNLQDFTPMSNGWLADSNQSPTITKPILFYNISQAVSFSSYKLGFLGKGGFTTYNRASNNTLTRDRSLNFGIEFDEFSGLEVTNSLFSKYYSEYISTIFDKQTRIFDLKMKANLAFLLDYKLNDTLLVKGEEFIINNIRTNLATGLTDIELILKFPTVVPAIIPSTPPTEPTDLTLAFASNYTLRFNWTASTDDIAVAGYKIYVNSVLFDTIAVFTEYTLFNLTNNTSYNIQVSAYDDNGNESTLSRIVAMSTTNTRDVVPPSQPQNIRYSNISDTVINLEWDASTDNIAVVGYDIYIDGVNTYTVAGLSKEITLLTSRTDYLVKVQAVDSAGNVSIFSDTLNIQTL